MRAHATFGWLYFMEAQPEINFGYWPWQKKMNEK